MRRRKFYLSQWQGAWNMVTQSSCNSKPTHAHFNYYDVCSCSALIALLVWAKDLNCQDHICSIFFLSSLELGNLQEGQGSFERAVCFLDSASPRVVSLGRPPESSGVEVSGSGNGLALFCPGKLWDSKPEHKGVFGENWVSVSQDGRIRHRKQATLGRSLKQVTAIIVTF